DAVVHDYFEGWYEGDAERMRRAVHPGLAKRAPLAALQAFRPDIGGDPDSLYEDTADTMIDATARGVGTTRATSAEERAIEVIVEGRCVEAYPETARRIVRAGHLIGNHSHYDTRMPLLYEAGLAADIAEAERVITELGANPKP